MLRPGGTLGGGRGRLGAGIAVLTVLVCLVATAGAGARGLNTGFFDNSEFASSDGSVRNTWFDNAVDAKAGIVRINVRWRDVVGSRPPVTPTNPADPAYDFDAVDRAVKDARARGLEVMLTVYAAPRWAEGKNRRRVVPAGAWKPDPAAYGKFAQALARRFSGNFPGLPRVRYFEAWNEPNLTIYLAPQWVGKKKKGPELYRKLLNRFYEGVKAGQSRAKVVGGATSPFGDSRTDPVFPAYPRMRPLAFLRKLLCLNGKLKRTKCKAKARLDVLSHHPINSFKGPHYKALHRDDVVVADFHKVGRVMRAAKRAKTVRPRGSRPLWATESGWFTDPPNRDGVPVKKHARWIAEELYLLWKQKAKVVINLEIRDQSYDPSAPPGEQWTTGVFFHDGDKKPAYRAFRFPFVTHRKSKKKISAWGKSPQAGKLKIQRKKNGKWRTKERLRVREGEVFKRKMRMRGKAKLRAKVGKTKSLPRTQGG